MLSQGNAATQSANTAAAQGQASSESSGTVNTSGLLKTHKLSKRTTDSLNKLWTLELKSTNERMASTFRYIISRFETHYNENHRTKEIFCVKVETGEDAQEISLVFETEKYIKESKEIETKFRNYLCDEIQKIYDKESENFSVDSLSLEDEKRT